LLRSSAFQRLGGSAIKVYLVIGLHSDFGTDWAYPSIRTIAKIAGLSRQTVLTAISDLCRAGMLATSKSVGRSTAYKIIRAAPDKAARPKPGRVQESNQTGPLSLEAHPRTGPFSLSLDSPTGLNSGADPSQFVGASGRTVRPEQEPETKENHSAAIPGTPFQITADGRLLLSVDLQELLTTHGIPPKTAAKLLAQKDAQAVAKVLLNAFYLERQGRLQNGAGYIRAGIEEGYELLPQVANHLESRRRQLQIELDAIRDRRSKEEARASQDQREMELDQLLDSMPRAQRDDLVRQAVTLLQGPLVRRNPTLSNPLVRSKVLELAGITVNDEF
jgi:hypothetical protein